MTKGQYRTIILLSILTGLASAYIDVVFPSLLPEGALDAIAADPTEEPVWKLVFLVLVALVAVATCLSGTFGLFFFRPWAPKLSLVGTVLTVPTLMLLGVNLSSGVAAALSYASTGLWGAVLLLSFLPEYRSWFRDSSRAAAELAASERAIDWP